MDLDPSAPQLATHQPQQHQGPPTWPLKLRTESMGQGTPAKVMFTAPPEGSDVTASVRHDRDRVIMANRIPKKPWRSGDNFIIVVQRQKGCKQWISIKIPIQVFPSHFSHEVAFYLIIVHFHVHYNPVYDQQWLQTLCVQNIEPPKKDRTVKSYWNRSKLLFYLSGWCYTVYDKPTAPTSPVLSDLPGKFTSA
jgi:hypothetical protein